MRNRFLDERTARDIDTLIAKILRGLGRPEPPLVLDDVRALQKLDRHCVPVGKTVFDCKVLSCCIQATLRHHRNRAAFAGNGPISKRRGDAYNAPRFLFYHLSHSALSEVEESKQIGGDKGIEVLGSEVSERLF